MKQEDEVDRLVRARIRGLRVAKGWSLDDLSSRCFLSPSTLSRIETGHRRIGLDQLTAIARALGATLDELVESAGDDDVVIRPQHDQERGRTFWTLNRQDGPNGMTVARVRLTRPAPRGADAMKVHPGHDWFTVTTGTVELLLAERVVIVEEGHAASFSTMVPHSFGAFDGPAEILAVLDHGGRRVHLEVGEER
ncbi:helix-turn-helix domain-containing protein [Kineosporia succinea]|uniref:Transcriptional regulator with XRE-family HTH domain n=1 Tax=Kineosporia succinea TaxID=84632 RepID=A0ABT9NZ88_9ACTN|nr:XRE family transcriptional regulator [Kineosporia succinea]MDP9825285.1 transcriptional regulator with XRE-family HTH domain [Kineosporia succinea]